MEGATQGKELEEEEDETLSTRNEGPPGRKGKMSGRASQEGSE